MSEKKMRRIEGLLARAAHPNTPEHERITAQEKADLLMAELQVDRATFNFNKSAKEVRDPSRRDYEWLNLVADGATGNSRRDREEWGIEGVINGIRQNIFYHAGAKCAHLPTGFAAVAYEEDLIYAEMLWLSVFQTILNRMFPTWDERKPFDENVYNLKKAGYSWTQVGKMGVMHGARDQRGELTMENGGSKLRTAFKRQAKRVGEEVLPGKQQPMNPHLWRRSFVDSFSSTISQRIAAMKLGREDYFDKSNLPAIVQDKDRVQHAFYEMFPDLNPANWPEPEPLTEEQKKENEKARKRVSHKVRAADPNAWAAGNAAAQSVNLGNNQQFEKQKEQLR